MHMNEPSGLSAAAIREYAERIAVRHLVIGGEDSPATDLDLLVRRLGIEVDTDPRPRDPDLLVQVRGDARLHTHATQKVIFLRGLPASKARRSMVVARLVGSYFLHYLYPTRDRVLDHSFRMEFSASEPQTELGQGRFSHDRMLVEANVFASTLLMPEARFRQQARACINDDLSLRAAHGLAEPDMDRVRQMLAGRFSTSTEAVRLRMDVLGIDQ